MPTLRLGDSERRNIRLDFDKVLSRAKYNQPFPLSNSDFPEFGYALLPDNLANAYRTIRGEPLGLHITCASTWRPEFVIKGSDFSYDISMNGEAAEVPCDKLLLLESHPKHAEILAWAESYSEMAHRVNMSMELVREIVGCSSSIGQVRRLLADEVMRFVPEHMVRRLQHAERRSRIPHSFDMDGLEGRMDNLIQTLAVASLSPEQRAGDIDATVDVRKPIA